VVSNILTTILGILTGTGILSAVTVCARDLIRYRAERERWRSVERLAERLGLPALTVLPDLARELRDPSPFAVCPRARGGRRVVQPRRRRQRQHRAAG
jgi:hypothetical protein